MVSDENRDIARKVYGTPQGRALLADLLNDLGFFSSVLETPVEIALENQAKILLEKLGVWNEHNMMRIVNALMDMPYTHETEKGEDNG
ncbi:hypothetical protein KAR91_69965 [Candidatus Pacearchaeota archaeon]|nr:hypothetical protein [Candidatus Pacearchaeota archaeon]